MPVYREDNATKLDEGSAGPNGEGPRAHGTHVTQMGPGGLSPGSAAPDEIAELVAKVERDALAAEAQLNEDLTMIRNHAQRAADIAPEVLRLQASLSGALELAARAAVHSQAVAAADKASDALTAVTDSLCSELHALLNKANETRARLAGSVTFAEA